MTKKKIKILFLLLALALIVGAFIMAPLFSHTDIEEEPEIISLDIACVGDVMQHSPQLRAQAVGDGTYYYDNNFEYVKKYIEEADLAICNVETTFAGAPYRGYPMFNSPDELATALATAGFDMASTANNHMLDSGIRGLLRTIEVLENNGIQVSGSRKDSDAPRYCITSAQGIEVALVSYTYQTPTQDGSVGINGNRISYEVAEHINSFNYADIDRDLDKIGHTVVEAREAGAEVVILFCHWGEEYQLSSNSWQRYMAEQLVNKTDADIIFGSHPHVLQEAVMYADKSGQRQVPVFFSLGNFISNQRYETMNGDRHPETGAIGQVKLEYNKDTGTVKIISMEAIPTWVDKYVYNQKTFYSIIPLDEQLSENETLALSGHLGRAKTALEDANGILKINRPE